jgi:chromosomal replication initiator protein
MIYPYSGMIPYSTLDMFPVRSCSHPVFEIVATETGITELQIIGGSRKRDIVIAKQMAMYLLRNRWGLTQDLIAAIVGLHDHTSVIHGVRTIESEYKRIPEIRAAIDRLMTA